MTTDIAEEVKDGWRLPGQEIEQTIAQVVRNILSDRSVITAALQESGIAAHLIPAALNAADKMQKNTAEMMDKFVKCVELQQDGIRLTLSLVSLIASETSVKTVTVTHDIPMRMKRRGNEMRLVIGGIGPARMDPALIKTIARAHGWFQDLVSGRVKNIAEIASREGMDRSDVHKRLPFAFLAPDIIEAIIAGQQPADLSTERLVKRIDLPLDWAEQRHVLGVA